MQLPPELHKRYTRERLSAREAQRLAEYIAFGPAIFQTARIMVDSGILDFIRDSSEGATEAEVAERFNLSDYAARCLLEASLSAGILLIDPESERFTISKTGWFLLNDPAVRVNLAFNHDVNYEGWFKLEESLRKGRPAGLEHFGPWPTVYEGLSKLPENVRRSWLNFDHFYSDSSFEEALKIVFADRPRTLLDVGGNTGRWASKCVAYDPEVQVTILDLPGQLGMMKEAVKGLPGADRIHGFEANLLDPASEMPPRKFDAIWMSQFLDCFSEEQVVDILRKAAKCMGPESRLYIMETLWDRQRFEPAALCLTMTSLYFTAIANGNSKMFRSDHLLRLLAEAGYEPVAIHDHLGQGHTIISARLK